jgi:RHS repeat-associated protein
MSDLVVGVGLSAKRGRRNWTIEEKLAIVDAAKRSGDPVSVVARGHGMNADYLFDWLQRDRDGTLDRRAVYNEADGPLAFVEAGVIGGEVCGRRAPALEIAACSTRGARASHAPMAHPALAQAEAPLDRPERVAGNLRWFALAANDNADRVTSIVHVFPNRTTDNVTFTYAYDPSGRDASLSLSNGAYAYVPTAATTSYATPNALNQYPSVNGYAYTYWPEGGLEQTDTVLARYNELGKLTNPSPTVVPGVVDPNNWEFVGIDALDHAYFHEAQTVSGQPYPFIYHWTDGLRPETILESQYQYQSGQTPVFQGNRRYVLGPDPDERWAFLDFNGTITYPHTDREGSLIALADGGEASSITTYDAYGQSTAAATDVGPGNASYLYRYTGQRLDPTTGLYDYKARDYSPGLGRFPQPDPAGLDQGPNLYEYVGNNPIGEGDPSGECPISTCGVGGGALDLGTYAGCSESSGQCDEQNEQANATAAFAVMLRGQSGSANTPQKEQPQQYTIDEMKKLVHDNNKSQQDDNIMLAMA